jgi:3-methylcrotonyl-CoA carboxylase alpha subunit
MTRFVWRDGDEARTVEVAPDGPGWKVSIDGVEFPIEAERLADGRWRLGAAHGPVFAEVTAAGERRFVKIAGLDFVLERDAQGRRPRARAHAGGLEAPMPGVVTRVMVAAGDEVRRGQPLIAVEAMKMEHLIRAPHDGKVRAILATAGEMVNGGATLVEMEEEGK